MKAPSYLKRIQMKLRGDKHPVIAEIDDAARHVAHEYDAVREAGNWKEDYQSMFGVGMKLCDYYETTLRAKKQANTLGLALEHEQDLAAQHTLASDGLVALIEHLGDLQETHKAELEQAKSYQRIVKAAEGDGPYFYDPNSDDTPEGRMQKQAGRVMAAEANLFGYQRLSEILQEKITLIEKYA